VQVGRTNTVSSLGLAKDVGGLPVQVGRTNTVSSLGLAKGVGGLPVQVHSHTVTSHASNITLHSGNANPALGKLTIVEQEVKCFSAIIG